MVTPRMSHVPPEPEPWQPHPWMADALCRQVGSEPFYPEPPEGMPATSAQRYRDRMIQAAKEACARCPVRLQCLDHAIAEDERYGVWGGMTRSERKAEAARRGRRKPEKPPVACGTLSGYWRHNRAKEPACEDCQPVGAAYFRAKRARRRAS